MAMKRIIILSMFTFSVCLSSEQGEELKDVADAIAVKRAAESEVDDVVDAKKPKTEARLPVDTLTSLCLKKIKEEDDPDVICLTEELLGKNYPDYTVAGVINAWAKDLLKNKSANYQALLMELAAYCAYKSMIFSKAQVYDAIHFACQETVKKKEPTQISPLVKEAANILKSFAEDPLYVDKAETHPLTLACMPKDAVRRVGNKALNFEAGYGQLQRVLLRSLNQDGVTHCVRQLIDRNEQAAVAFLKANPQALKEYQVAYHLCRWADLHDRPAAMAFLQECLSERHKKPLSAAWPAFNKECECSRLLYSYMRAAYVGDKEFIESMPGKDKVRIRQIGWGAPQENMECCFGLMYVAAFMGYIKLLHYYLEQKLEVSQHHVLAAVDQGHKEVVDLLLPHLKEPITDKNWHFRAPAMGYIDAIKKIMHVIDSGVFDQLLFIAAGGGTSDIVSYLLDIIEDKIKDEKLKAATVRRALCIAVSEGKHDNVRLLISRSVALNGFAQWQENKKFHKRALFKSNPLHEMAEYLISKVTEVMAPGEQPDQGNAFAPQQAVMMCMLAHGALDEPDEKGKTALAKLQEEKRKWTDPSLVLGPQYIDMRERIKLLNPFIKMLTEYADKDLNKKYTAGLWHYNTDEAAVNASTFDVKLQPI